jgi:hypothetical protein
MNFHSTSFSIHWQNHTQCSPDCSKFRLSKSRRCSQGRCCVGYRIQLKCVSLCLSGIIILPYSHFLWAFLCNVTYYFNARQQWLLDYTYLYVLNCRNMRNPRFSVLSKQHRAHSPRTMDILLQVTSISPFLFLAFVVNVLDFKIGKQGSTNTFRDVKPYRLYNVYMYRHFRGTFSPLTFIYAGNGT